MSWYTGGGLVYMCCACMYRVLTYVLCVLITVVGLDTCCMLIYWWLVGLHVVHLTTGGELVYGLLVGIHMVCFDTDCGL